MSLQTLTEKRSIEDEQSRLKSDILVMNRMLDHMNHDYLHDSCAKCTSLRLYHLKIKRLMIVNSKAKELL